MDHFLHHLIEQIDPQFIIVIGQNWCCSKNVLASFLHCCYEWLKWYYFILYIACSTYANILGSIVNVIEGLHDHLTSTRIFTLIMQKIVLRAPKLMRHTATSPI